MHPCKVVLPILLLAGACSARNHERDGGTRPDAGTDAALPDAGASSCECTVGAHNELIFLMDDGGELWSWDPRSNAFAFVVGPVCSGMRPFSMAVDARGLAWLVFIDSLSILTFDVNDPGPCEDSGYLRRNPDFGLFGMSFASNSATDACADLYVHTYDGEGGFEEGPGLGKLGVIDAETKELRELAVVDYDGGELTGTGDGRLFALAGADPVKLVEYDRTDGSMIETIPLDGFRKTNASAAAFYAGDIYLFIEAVPEGCTECLETTCPDALLACQADEVCNEHLLCAIEAADVRDDCGGLLTSEMTTCVTDCSDPCFIASRGRVSRVLRYDLDGSSGGGIEVVVEHAPIRVVGAATSPCVQTIPF